MKCPFCGAPDTRVQSTRIVEDGRAVRRRRVCDVCNKRFTTFERIEVFTPMVVKKDGRRETFDRAKVLEGIKTACRKRPVGIDTIEGFVDRLFYDLQENMRKEVSSTWIGQQVMDFLKEVDKVAYIRFASVYKTFQELEDFKKELESVEKNSEK